MHTVRKETLLLYVPISLENPIEKRLPPRPSHGLRKLSTFRVSIDWKQYSNEADGAEKPEEGVVFVLLPFEGMIAYFCRKTLGGEQRRRIVQSP